MSGQELFDKYRREAPRLYSAVLADVMDSQGHNRQALPGVVSPLDPSWKLFGRVRTLSMRPAKAVAENPYALEMKAIDHLHEGDVLVIQMSGCPACAVWGELLSMAAKARGAAGAVMDGPTRDVEKILGLQFPTFAVGTSPLDSKGRIEGVAWDEPITIGAVLCRPGDLIFGDRDGVVVIPSEISPVILPAALAKVSGENTVRQELAEGRPVSEVFARHGIL